MQQSLTFSPLPLLSSPTTQTILGNIPTLLPEPPSLTHLIPRPDGDFIACEVSTPPGWQAEDPTAILIHGLCGSHRSPSLVRLARQFYQKGVKAIRMNLRGCGSGKGYARQPYHGGCSADAIATVQAFKTENPASPISLIGFSIGGNIALKAAAETDSTLLDLVVAISPPVNLGISVQLMGLPRNRLYENVFVKGLLQEVEDRQKLFPDIDPLGLPDNLKMFAFDQLYTAPTCGFNSALDYYARGSSYSLIPNIATRCHILFAQDDPIVDPDELDNLSLPNNVHVWKTRCGGHMGYLSLPKKGRKLHWLDQLITQWVLAG